MRCPSCRVVVTDETAMCPKCGARLRGAFDEPPAPIARPPRRRPTAASRAHRSAPAATRTTSVGQDDADDASDFELELERAFEGDDARSRARARARRPEEADDDDGDVDDAPPPRKTEEAANVAARLRARAVEMAEAEARRIVERAETDATTLRLAADRDIAQMIAEAKARADGEGARV